MHRSLLEEAHPVPTYGDSEQSWRVKPPLLLGLRHPICGYRCLVWMYPDHLGTKYRWFGPFLHQIERYSNEFGMMSIASLENCAQVSSFSSITVVRSLQPISISYYSGPNTSTLTICGHRSGGESLIRVAANLVIFAQLIQGNPVRDSRQRSIVNVGDRSAVLERCPMLTTFPK